MDESICTTQEQTKDRADSNIEDEVKEERQKLQSKLISEI